MSSYEPAEIVGTQTAVGTSVIGRTVCIKFEIPVLIKDIAADCPYEDFRDWSFHVPGERWSFMTPFPDEPVTEIAATYSPKEPDCYGYSVWVIGRKVPVPKEVKFSSFHANLNTRSLELNFADGSLHSVPWTKTEQLGLVEEIIATLAEAYKKLYDELNAK